MVMTAASNDHLPSRCGSEPQLLKGGGGLLPLYPACAAFWEYLLGQMQDAEPDGPSLVQSQHGSSGLGE